MALITTIAEIQAVLPRLVSNLSETSTLPNFDRVERKYLVPICGLNLYNDLKTKYAGGTLSVPETALVNQMRLVVVAYGFLDELPFTHAMITDNGVRKATTANLPSVYGWEFKELKNALNEAAIDGIEVLLAGLVEFNSALWTASTEYSTYANLLIRTGTEFDSIVKLHQPLRTFWSIRAVIADVQEMYIQQSIGPDLLDHLKAIAAPTTAQKYILKLLKKALAHYSIKHACEHYTTRFDTNGFTVVAYIADGEDSTVSGRTTAKDLLDMKMRASERDAAAFLAKARNEMVAYYEDASAEYKAAFDAGPLASYTQPSERDRGNDRAGIFRF